MPKTSLMKRLSKSATDLSNCTKKTRSTSDEDFNEAKPGFTRQQASDDETESLARPHSAQSSASVPAISILGRGSRGSRSNQERSASGYRARSHSHHRSEKVVQERSIAAEIEAVQRSANYGIFGLLRHKFRLSSRERQHQHSQEQIDPCRHHLQESHPPPPEVIRIRCEGERNPNYQLDSEGAASSESGTDSPLKRPQVVRRTLEEDSRNQKETPLVIRKQRTEGGPASEGGALKKSSKPPGVPSCPSTESNSTPVKSGPQLRNADRQDSRSSFMSLLSRHKVDSVEEAAAPPREGSFSPTTAPLDVFHSTEELHEYSRHHLFVHLMQGHDLPAKDSCGTSDPYVKFFLGPKMVYKSKTITKDLNPCWDENFHLTVEDLNAHLELKVYDYDWGLRDDFIGEASVDLRRLPENLAQDLLLTLCDSGHTEYLGQISLNVKLVPVKADLPSPRTVMPPSHTAHALSHSHTPSPVRGLELAARRLKAGTWYAVVNILLVEGRDLLAMDIQGTSDPYCKFRLGNDRFKSKTVYGTLNPKWNESFDLYLYEDPELEITVWDKDQRSKDDFMGRCCVDVSSLSRERSHELWLSLEDGAGKLFIILTVSGTTGPENPTFLSNWDSSDEAATQFVEAYAWRNTFSKTDDVGLLVVKVYRARGLYAADLGGSSDPFAVLELDNTRLATHTEYKTLDPAWHRVFTLQVKDVHSVLHVTVYDEDKNHKSEFLGKLAIPLLKLKNHERKWFALKDKKLRCRAKGTSPQIQLEFQLEWNIIRATITTLNPRDKIYSEVMEKFKRQVFINNVMRIKAVILDVVNFGKFIQSCLEWEHTGRSIIAFLVFMTITYYFEPYMVPVGLLLIFLKHYLVTSYIEHRPLEREDGYLSEEDDDLDDKEEEKEEKKSFKEKLQAIQDVTATVQNALGYVAGLAEGVKNTFNFTVPYLSWLAIIILAVISLVLYFIPLRLIVMLWGVNKFSKKLIRPNTVTNNELMDFLSRVPNDEMILDARELRLLPEPEPTPSKKGTMKKKTKQT